MRRSFLLKSACALALLSVVGACHTSSSSTNAADNGTAALDDAGLSGNGADANTNANDGASPDVPTGPPAVQFIGRFDTRDPQGPIGAWPGCRIIARFSGTSVSVRLSEIDDDWMDGSPSEWDVAIDNVLSKTKLVMTPGTNNIVLAQGLAPGDHVVELYKRTEAQVGSTQFLGYDFGAGGTLLAPPTRKTRRIEMIGDSAIAGFGIEGVGQGPDCPGLDYAAKWENFHLSASAVLGVDLDAEVAGTVYSGKGIAQNIWTADLETMPQLFTRAAPVDPTSTWDFSLFTPDVVVIVMGGNDFAIGQPNGGDGATLAAFTSAYDSFITLIRQHYASAFIFLVASPSLSDAEPEGRLTRTNVLAGIQSVVTSRNGAGDAKVSSIIPPIATPEELTACDGHGSPAFHQRFANDLATPIRLKIGW